MAEDFQERKPQSTVTLSHKQIAGGGGLIAALAVISQLSARYTPVEKTQSQDQQITAIVMSISTLRNEMQTSMQAQTTAITNAFTESQKYTKAVVDAQGKRLDDTVGRVANLELQGHDRNYKNR